MEFLEFKDFVGSVKDVDTSGRRVTGYLSAFDDKIDNDGDIAEFGMFTKTVAERGPMGSNEIYFLNHHEWKQPHGFFAVLEEKEEGLYFESEKLPNTSYSNDALILYDEGILKQHSFGYVTLKSIQDSQRNARRLKEVKMFEGSNVTLGSDPNTPFLGFKSLTFKEVNEKSNDIIKMLRKGSLTDDTYILLEIALKQLQREAYELGKKALEKEPGSSTRKIEPLHIIKQFNNDLILK